MKIPAHQASLAVSIAMMDLLAKKFSRLSISDPTRTQKAVDNEDSHLDTSDLSWLEIPSEVQVEDPRHFSLELKN